MTEKTTNPLFRDEIDESFEKFVWDSLSRIDTEEHVDRIPATKNRPEVSYLAWHTAWMLLKRKFPGSTYSHRADLHHPDGTVECEVDVNIAGPNGRNMFTNARLAVMDFHFGAIKNPTAREVNDCRQRTLVKALAFAGLGLNLWADTAIPVGKLDDPITEEQYMQLREMLDLSKANEALFLKWGGVEDLSELPYEKFLSARRMLQSKIDRLETDDDHS